MRHGKKSLKAKPGTTIPKKALSVLLLGNFYQHQFRSQVKILEVGCGPGANIWYLAREGFDVYGIDGSSTGIAKAQAFLKKENLNAHLSIGDVNKLP